MNELWEGTEAKIMDQDIRIHLYFMKNHKQWAINTLNDENWIIFLVFNYLFIHLFLQVIFTQLLLLIGAAEFIKEHPQRFQNLGTEIEIDNRNSMGR